ncbi:MAG: TauD/TfdA family dioxygenase [Anaerolineae bacterium]|nr:TauD/TfdA family dioxygenase [Anaerolineae bacterium]
MNLQQEIATAGYVLIDDLGLDDPNAVMEQVLSTFARPISYVGLPLVMDLRPQPGFQPASFAGTGEFNMHTDLSWYEKPPKYIAMFCVANETAHGGVPLLSDGWAALEDLSVEEVAYLKTEPVTFPPPSHIDYAPLTGPIIREIDGKLVVRFRFDMLENPSDPIRHYFEAINRHIIHIRARPGSLFIFDNDRMLHGRTELKAGMGSDRHFKRMYGEEVPN